MVVKFFKLNSQRVYQGGWEAKTTRQLKQRINRKLIKINSNLIQRVMLGLKSKLRKIADVLYNPKITSHCPWTVCRLSTDCPRTVRDTLVDIYIRTKYGTYVWTFAWTIAWTNIVENCINHKNI